ncbi:cupin domain-containing protein [Lutimonas zeaxanthinifaciens]|uniref:cupin domain-containing protein n=1 Tax=Lutimonas zeaxanthinifaciens TaxID=3060215 RepID=UPI00265D4ACC|nr:cupin domain-containing protein [Lutimonas sp. YSD2104]WKK67101.1 cupin domain-containing protein [Lutimonas sp. YSD2104]
MKTFKIKPYQKIMMSLAFVLLTIGVNAQSHEMPETENSIATTIDNKDLEWLPAPDFFPDCSFTILHGDITKPNLDFFFRIEPNTKVINHTHNSPERMILISGDLEVQYEGEEPVVLKAGSYAYGPGGKPHKAKCLDNGPCVLFVAMVDPFDAVPVKKE